MTMYHWFGIGLYKCFWEHGAPISSSRTRHLLSFGFSLIESRHGIFLIALGARESGTYHADNEKWKLTACGRERAFVISNR